MSIQVSVVGSLSQFLSRQVKVDSLFVEYRIQSNTNNQITLSMSSEALLTTLRSACTPSNNTGLITDAEVVMKYVRSLPYSMYTTLSEHRNRLAKKNDQAVLTFEILGATRGNRRVRVTQDIRIEVMKLQDVERLQEPLCPEPDVRHMFLAAFIFIVSIPPVRCIGPHIVASPIQAADHHG